MQTRRRKAANLFTKTTTLTVPIMIYQNSRPVHSKSVKAFDYIEISPSIYKYIDGEVTDWIFSLIRPIFLPTCATCSELP